MVWCYDQPHKDGSRTYTGHVLIVDGAEGEKLRHRLTDVLHELLVWAAQHEIGQAAERGEDA